MVIKIPACIINQIDTLYYLYENVEVGGVLLGSKDFSGFTVTNIVYNLRNKSLYAYYFNRTIHDIADEITHIINSNNNINYIGEWHTHPKQQSMFSIRDRISFLDLNKDFEQLILLIKGADGYSSYTYMNGVIAKTEIAMGE